MRRLMSAEWMKVQHLLVLILIVINAVVNAGMGINMLQGLSYFFTPGWDTLYYQMSQFHALFFYPLYVGIFASLLCRYEHAGGGWKQMFCLPVRRSALYGSKLGMLMLLMGGTQLVFVIAYLLAGWAIQVPGQLDWAALMVSSAGGWLAILPFAALQLGLSLRLKSFAASLILSISLVIPNIVLTGLHASIGAWFPFTATYYAMFPRGAGVSEQVMNLSPRVDGVPFMLILAGTFLVYAWGGRRLVLSREGRL